MNKNLMKTMLGILLLSVFLSVPQLVNAKSCKGINIKKTFVKGMCEELSEKFYDKNQDGYLSKSEIKQIKELDLFTYYQNFDLKGISKLKYLEKIDIEPEYYVYNLKELKKLPKLKYIRVVTDSKKKITLDLRRNKKLKTLIVYTKANKGIVKIKKNNKICNVSLLGVQNSISIINKCHKAKAIEFDSYHDNISLNIKNRKKLTNIHLLHSDGIKTLSIRNCANLKTVEIYEGKIGKCVLQNTPNLKNITINESKISALTIDNLKRLQTLKINDTKLSSISIKKLNGLRTLKMDCVKGLSDMTITDLSKLKKIDINNVPQLKCLTLEEVSKLKNLTCTRGALSELNILGENQISEISIYNNKLKKFEYDNLKKLRYLECDNNKLEGKFDFTLYPKLYKLYCRNNQLTEIYGGDCNREIDIIDCYNNKLKIIDFKAMKPREGFIYYLNCKKNPNVEVYAVIEHTWKHDSTAKLY